MAGVQRARSRVCGDESREVMGLKGFWRPLQRAPTPLQTVKKLSHELRSGMVGGLFHEYICLDHFLTMLL